MDLTAKEARVITESAKRDVDISEYTRKISQAAMLGKSSLTENKILNNLVINKLSSLGYKVTKEYGDQREPYSQTTIKW